MNEKVELIVGPRFQFTQADIENANNPMHFPGLRGGHGPTTIIDWMPISGPIVRRESFDSKSGKYKWHAVCMNGFCLQTSKLYLKKNENALFRWAVHHRCPRKDWEYIGYGKDWLAVGAQKMEDGQ